MWKTFAAVFAAVAFSPCLVHAGPPDVFEKGMNTLWEALWHQSGTPTRLVRWEQDIHVRVHGVNAAARRPQAVQALREAAAVAGIKVIDVSDRPNPEQHANVSIEIVANSMLHDNQPCVTQLQYQAETRIDSATLQLRDSDADRCAFHEAMHVMGVRGHPEGETVLSYFAGPARGLQPLDQAMLRAWYAPRVRAGMTPFEVMPVLAEELVRILPDRPQALRERDRFFAHTVAEMQAFAEGKGDVPSIVKRCGKATGEGIRYGRMEMSYFLGVAYQQGATVAPDPAQATRWLQRAASLGSRSALARLARA